MDTNVLIFILLTTHGVTTESLKKTISIYAHEEDEVILLLPEHLLDQAESLYVWKKGGKSIATDGYPEIRDLENIKSSPEGSLIIQAGFWEDEDEYSVDIITNNSRSSVFYRVRVHNHKYTEDSRPTDIFAKVGENVTLPLDSDIFQGSEIIEIDWLTDRWVYFAITKIGGEIRILKDIYKESLSSSSNGSLIFTKVSPEYHGVYRACIFSNKGKIMEQMFHLHISETHKENFTFGEYIFIIIMVSIGILICIWLGRIVCAIYRRCKEEIEEMGEMEEMGELEEIEEKEPKRRQYNQEEPYRSHLEYQSELPNSMQVSV